MIRWKLNEVMSQRRIRNKDLAHALGITENSIYRLRKSDEMPRLTPQRLEGICAALRCQPGELLAWEPASDHAVDAVIQEFGIQRAPETGNQQPAVLVQKNLPGLYPPLSTGTLKRLTEFYEQILSLSWQGHTLYGPGAVIFTDWPGSPQISYVEQENLADPNCQYVIEQNRPELAAVVLYYSDTDYTTADYELLTLTGPKSPPECFSALHTGNAP